ncbi:hypothetical protein PMZ80_006126 [Knufia obscura]|uniref:Uncharacterized protein n=1 Tax=Knufia obscura TaxID=1635080 RepID=A0ABR0RNK5_9EURO|nr:hypothetical protein PMZ80_006126 [Knufia obscura]
MPSTTSPTDSSTTAPAYTPTLAPSPDSELSKGAIAGIASGSVIGGILILIILALFIRRHRHHAKRRLAAATAADSAARDQTEKAQLHSDEYKPPREELEGSKAPMILRTIEGLHEMEYREMSSARVEMDANEVAAAELRGETFSTPITESSTLVGRSSQGAEQGM